MFTWNHLFFKVVKIALTSLLALLVFAGIKNSIVLAQHGDMDDDSCMLDTPAFCDTFDIAHPGGKAGDLDEIKWSVARVGEGINPSQGQVVQWTPAILNRCMTHVNVNAPEDFAVCNSHFMEAMNDGGGYIYNAIRARQLFDFKSQTSKIVFDVDAKAAGHGWWIETWIADEPVPGPYVGAPSNNAIPKNGIGFVFGECHEPDSAGLDKVFIVKNYSVTNAIDWIQGDTELHVDGCFTPVDNIHNRLEIRISPTRFEVWASDAGEDEIRRIAWSDTVLDRWIMPLTRGYVSFLHVQYNAEKFGHVPDQTYHWDNIGFDGPVYPLARGYDIPDALIDSKDPRFTPGTLNLGFKIGKDGSIESCCEDNNWISYSPFVFDKVDLSNVSEARLNLNLWYFQPGDILYYRFNGKNWKEYAHPFPDSSPGARGLSIPIHLADLVSGKNSLELRSSGEEDFITANIGLELSLASGIERSEHLFLPYLMDRK